MAICPSDYCDRKLKQLHKMSMVPLPCQECQLKANGCTTSEEIEWVADLKDSLPIWSRLTTFNTMGFNRKLPMAMTKAYDVEINGRLWSLWGNLRKNSMPTCHFLKHNKLYLAATVMGLCAARVFRLNIWTPQLLDCIISSSEWYLKESLEKCKTPHIGFQLEHLASECSLQGIHFEVCIETCQEGCLYGAPFRGCENLAFGLVNFLRTNQFGIVECFNRYLGFGYIKGREGGYFMFDAQSMNYPLFPRNYWAPYILRMNHLQVLLYCIVVSLNVPYTSADYAIHTVHIGLPNSHAMELKEDSSKLLKRQQRILPKEYWRTPTLMSMADSIPDPEPEWDAEIVAKSDAKIVAKSDANKKEVVKTDEDTKDADKVEYRRVVREVPELHVEDYLIMPMVETTEEVKQDHDFVKMICSETVIPVTAKDKSAFEDKSFVMLFPDALFMR